MEQGIIWLDTLELPKYKILGTKNPAQQQNRARASPSGTACLIGKPGLMEPVLERFGASSCSPSGAKTSQMGVSNPDTPKYKISRPKSLLNAPNSERNHPTATSGIVDVCLLAAPTHAPRVTWSIIRMHPIIMKFPRYSNENHNEIARV
jgi:hypothetical protein